jgi:hypothetical protein
MQAGWRWCNQCQGLAFSGHSPGVCPAGGPHDYTQSGDYALGFAATGTAQTGWRWCNRCQGLAFSFYGAGVCPAGGSHDYSQSGDYALESAGTGIGQPGWRWCNRCQGLAFSFYGAGVCPAGGSHDYSQSGDYEVTDLSSPSTGTGTASPVEASRNLIVGFNYPWAWNAVGLYFGGGDPPGSTAAMDDWIKHLRTNLHILKTDLNIWHVRIFLLCNCNNYGTTTKLAPHRLTPPSTLHRKFTDHLKQMLDAFESEDMLVIPSLVSFDAFWPLGRMPGTGARADIANAPSVQSKFFSQVLDPFLSIASSYKCIFAWEVINEPIWDTSAAHATFLTTWKTKRPALVLHPDVLPATMETFINEALSRISKAGFASTVGHRYFDDLAALPTGMWRQFHYYPDTVKLPGLPSISLPYTDPYPLPDFATSQSFIGEFSCTLPGNNQGGAWPELNGADTVNVTTAVYERLRLLNHKGYGLALVWPDLKDPVCCGPDPVRLSMAAQAGIKKFLAAP